MGFEVIPKDPCIIKKKGIFILYYINDIVFAYNKNYKKEVKGYVIELQKKFHFIGGNDL